MFRSQLVSNKNKMSIEQKRGITGNGIEIAGGMESVYISPYLKIWGDVKRWEWLIFNYF
jgi:hypothetical protein